MGEEPDTLSGGSDRADRRPPRRRVWVGAAVVAGVIASALAVRAHDGDRHRSVASAPPAVGRESPSTAPGAASGSGRRTYTVLGGRLRVSVVGLTPSQPFGRAGLDTDPNAPPVRRADTAQVAVTGRLEGGRPGVRYRLAAGDCVTGSRLHRPWASGTADRRGTAVLAGRPVTVTKAHDYYVELHPSPARPGHAVTGVTGFLAAGKAEPFRPSGSRCR